MLGKHHSEETKKKIGIKNKNHLAWKDVIRFWESEINTHIENVEFILKSRLNLI